MNPFSSWGLGIAFAAGLLVGGFTGSTLTAWRTAHDRAEALEVGMACQTGRADANAAATVATGEVRKDLQPLVTTQRETIAGLQAQLAQIQTEIHNDPIIACLATPDDIARMRRLETSAGDSGDRPAPG